MTTFDYPGSPASSTFPQGINNLGQIVGNVNYTFLKTGNTFTPIVYPGAAQTQVYRINNLGHIVGVYEEFGIFPDRKIHGFLYKGGVFTDLDYPPGLSVPHPPSQAFAGINDEGHVVGGYLDPNNVWHGLLATPEINDSTPPAISGMPSAGCKLWSPNRQLVQVALVTATDSKSGIAPGSFKITGESNEPFDSKNPDIVMTPNGPGGYVVQLRADRDSKGTGRIYSLTATAADLAGNTATATATCVVPHDQRK